MPADSYSRKDLSPSRFEKFVYRTSNCWFWIGSIDRLGYGHFDRKSPFQLAHRAAWLFAKGEIPKGMLVLHTCDIPQCVNPEHLFLGTHRQNASDMLKKGRGLDGITRIKSKEEGENMGAADYYDDLNERLASDSHCLSEEEAEQEAEEKRVAPLLAKVLLEHMVPVERESTQEEVNQAMEQEQIIEASRSVRAGTDLLMAALRKNGVL